MPSPRISNAVLAQPTIAPIKPLLTPEQERKALRNELLPTSSPLRMVAAELDVRWGDENIMSGVAGTFSGAVSKSASATELQRFTTNFLQSALSYSEDDGSFRLRGSVQFESKMMSSAVLDEMAKLIARDGFCYDTSNADNVKGVRRDLGTLLKPLGKPEDLRVLKATRDVKIANNAWRKATVHIIENVKTGELAGVYTRGGWD